MNMKFKKALSELRMNPRRTALVIFALAIGIWGVGSLMVSTTILRNDLRENFSRTSPPHAVLISEGFGRLDLATFRSRPEIENAEFRDLSLQRIEVHPDEWIPLWLFGVEDFDSLNLARFYNEKGKNVPDPGTMLIERDGQLISRLTLGSLARVRAEGRVIEVPITGISFDPAQAPATQDHFIYAYVDKTTYMSITGERTGRRLILRLKEPRTRQDVQSAVDCIVDDLRSSGITVATVNVPKLNEHPHQWQLDTLLLLQGSIAFLALLMGAVLVSQLMAAILSRQIRQIGILKAIGASRSDIFHIYLAMVIVFGIAAGVLAMPLAVATGYAFSRFVAAKLNFNILTTSLPLYLYVVQGTVALLMPALFSLPSLVRGIRVSVQQALSDYGISQLRASGSGSSTAPWPLPAGVLLAFRNTLRRKRRIVVTVITMALGVAIFSTGFNVRQSLGNLLSDVREGMRHDVQVVLRQQLPRDQALAPFRSLENLDRIETWSGGIGELQSNVVATDDGTGIIALPYNTDLMRLRIEKGRWLRGFGEREVVLNQKAMEKYRLQVGEMVTLNVAGKRLPFRLVGVVWELDKAKIYMDREQYDAIANPGHMVNSLMFVAKDRRYDKIIDLKRDIEKAIAPTDLNVLYVMSQAERVKVIYDHLNIILTTIVFLALTVLVVSALGMASATGISIMERTREIGVLRAIGATPEMIYRLFVFEGMIVSVTSVFLGLLLAWPLSVAASPFFGSLMLGEGALLRFAFSANGFWITLVTTIAFGWLASRIPARRAIEVSTREALMYE
jgi:putative ABC transport system permease protein